MIRTRVHITEEQAAVLRAMSAERHRSVAELIRMSIDSFLQREAGIGADSKRERARSAAGRFSSAVCDVSSEHDKYLAKALGQQ